LQLTNAPTIVVHSKSVQVRSQLNAKTLGDTASMTESLPYPDHAFAPLESFRLIWRWKSPRHAVFPPEILALVRPFTSSAALTLNAEALARVPSLNFPGDASFACGENVPEADVSMWLRKLSVRASAWTVLSWDRELALLVPWDVFADRWSDFCYPASDDVHLWQPGADWTLSYQHSESFQYFRHRAARVV
jgi:hypothetical protein